MSYSSFACRENILKYSARSDARFETTAAWQAAETSTTQLQNEVERNAQQVHQVAEQAASSAQVCGYIVKHRERCSYDGPFQYKTPAVNGAVDQLEEGLSEKTNQAVADGQSTVDSAKVVAGGYVQQAREVVGGAMATAAVSRTH